MTVAKPRENPDRNKRVAANLNGRRLHPVALYKSGDYETFAYRKAVQDGTERDPFEGAAQRMRILDPDGNRTRSVFKELMAMERKD